MTAIATGLYDPTCLLLSGRETRGAISSPPRIQDTVRISRSRRLTDRFAPDCALTDKGAMDLPRWVEPVANAFADLLALRENWDSYGARAIDPREVEGALGMLLRTLNDNSPTPHIGPTARGGVVMEWHRNGIDFEIETLSPQRFSVAFDDGTKSWEREIVSDFRTFVDILRRLA